MKKVRCCCLEQVVILDIPVQFGDRVDTIHPVVLLDEHERVLVDCGYVGFLEKIETALLEQGIVPASITKIIISHHDHDHMGSLRAFKEKYTQVEIVASELEAPYIEGALPSLRLEQAVSMQEDLQGSEREFGEQFIQLLRSVSPAFVNRTVKDGDVMDWCGGCHVLATPGHMPGHISLYLPKQKVMITGDAMAIEDGIPVIANPQFTLDEERAKQSLTKLLRYEVDTFVCYHGGIYTPQGESKELLT